MSKGGGRQEEGGGRKQESFLTHFNLLSLTMLLIPNSRLTIPFIHFGKVVDSTPNPDLEKVKCSRINF